MIAVSQYGHTLVFESNGSVTPYVSYYLSATKYGEFYQWFYHSVAITTRTHVSMFTHAGALTRVFAVTATLSCQSGNNNQVGCYIAKNGVVIDPSEVYVENNTATNNILVTDLNVIIR